MISVILAGGKGIRLWPESRRTHPKQLCNIVANRTMLDHTIDRLINAGAKRVVIITNDELLADIEKLIKKRNDDVFIEILSEPEGRNTAPAVGLALAKCGANEEETVLGVFPSDHHVLNNDSFCMSIQKAILAAEQNHIATIGVAPSRPETDYGYIEKSRWEIGELPDVYGVDSFCEKPDISTAQSYINTGRHVWNSGIYVGKVKTLREEFARYLPEVHTKMLNGYEHYIGSYSDLPNISLDYGIAEKSSRMAVVESNFGWCDLGNWNSLADITDKDEYHNILAGTDVLALESSNCLVKQSAKTTVLFGVQNLLVVETDDVILVANREKSQDIRSLVELLKQKGRYDLL
ncbi:MAG: sugar phosphate nucleotidyltransferase [Syntrophomonas sp.]|nr:sugar phosphate nucleotidyltransferase [Syntrophomonas sp.]